MLELLRPNALYLSTAAQANHPVLLPLYLWFQRNMWLAEADSRQFRQALTAEMLDDEHRRDAVLKLLVAADLGITGARKRKLDPVLQERVQRAIRILTGTESEPEDEEAPTLEELVGIDLIHRGVDGEYLIHSDYESLGTIVWFGLIGPVLQSLEDGSVFLVDELDSSLHSDLIEQLVRMFQDPETNPHRAQLIWVFSMKLGPG